MALPPQAAAARALRLRGYIAAQRAREWRGALVEEEKDVGEVHVGVMGLGGMGGTSAGLLSRTGFQVRGWVRGGGSPREVPGVAVHEGEVGLGEFLTGLDILVCLLPLTPDTRGIINAELLSKVLPPCSWGHLCTPRMPRTDASSATPPSRSSRRGHAL